MEAIASVAGGLMGSDSASDAANIQAGATREANALTQKQFNQVRTDLEPWRNQGATASNDLAFRLGLGGGTGGDYRTKEQIKNSLLSQYTTQQQTQDARPQAGYLDWAPDGSLDDRIAAIARGIYGGQQPQQSTVDEAGLNAAVERAWADQEARSQAARNDPSYGSLLKPFTGADLQSEPGYQFGLDQGLQSQDRLAAKNGSLFSGAALKAAQRFGQDYASTKYDAAFNRDAATKDRTYNYLSGVSNSGLNAAAQTGAQGTSLVNSMANNITSLGNAQGAAKIAQGNAWTSGISNGLNNYNQNQLLQKITSGNAGWGSASTPAYTPTTDYSFNPNYALG